MAPGHVANACPKAAKDQATEFFMCMTEANKLISLKKSAKFEVTIGNTDLAVKVNAGPMPVVECVSYVAK